MTTRYAILRHGKHVGWDHASQLEAELWIQTYCPTEYLSEYQIIPFTIEDPDDEC